MRRLLTLCLLLAATTAAPGQTFTTSRVTQSGDTPPGATNPFPNSNFTSFPAVDSTGTVAFTGTVSSVPRVYTGVGGGPLTLAVNVGTAIPDGGAATFQDFGGSVGIGAGGVAFWGANAASSPTLQGIYLTSGGTTTRIADTTVTAPGQATAFTGFSSAQLPSVSGTDVAFRGTFAGGSGLYTRAGGTLVRVADTTTAIPNGTGNFSALTGANQVLSGSTVVFRASGAASQQGIYLRDLSNESNPLIRVTDKTLQLPGGGGLITTLFEPSVSGNDVTLIATGNTGTQRVVRYAWNGSSTAPSFAESVLTKTGDAVPEQPGLTFTGYQGFSPSDSGNVAVIGRFNNGADRTGIYWHDGNTLHRVIDSTQLLDGKVINSFLLGGDAVAGQYVTFHVTFADATRGVYVARFVPVPEPGFVVAVSAALVGGVGIRRRLRARGLQSVQTPRDVNR